MRAAALLVVAACGGGAAPPGPARAAPVDPILERAPCAIEPDHAAYAAAIDAMLRPEHEAAGLPAPDTAALFPADEHARLVAAARAGRCARIVYRSDGLRVVGFVVRPPDILPGRHPVLLWLRGGSRDFGKIGDFALVHLLALADAGFVVVATQHRGVDGGEGADEYGGAEVADVHALVDVARAEPDGDAARLYLVGGSRGAMEGLLAIRDGLPVRAAAFRGGLYDLRRAIAHRPDMERHWATLMPDLATDRDGALARRSATTFADRVAHVPMLLVHGTRDHRVPVDDAIAFAEALDAVGPPPEIILYADNEHQVAVHRTDWLAEVVAFFARHGAFADGAGSPASHRDAPAAP